MKVKELGYKIVFLILGWFALLFCIELVLRIVLWVVALIVRGVVSGVTGGEKKASLKEKEE